MNNFSVHLWQRSATSQVGYLCKFAQYFLNKLLREKQQACRAHGHCLVWQVLNI